MTVQTVLQKPDTSIEEHCATGSTPVPTTPWGSSVGRANVCKPDFDFLSVCASIREIGREVDCAGLENRSGGILTAGSNPASLVQPYSVPDRSRHGTECVPALPGYGRRTRPTLQACSEVIGRGEMATECPN